VRNFLKLFYLCITLSACQTKKQRSTTLPPGTVTHIVDGDTFDMADSTGNIIRIRPIGINADEMKDNNHGKKGSFAKAAKDYLVKLVLKKTVRLEMDIQKTDRYGRTLAYVYLNDTVFVNAEMIKAGLAVIETIPPNVKYSGYFYQLQQEAKIAKTGMWNTRN
jgi:micrococcal nuclease